MSVSPGNSNNLQAWEEELAKGIEVLEALEYAMKVGRTLGGAGTAVGFIDTAHNEMSKVVSAAALKAGRLRRNQVVADTTSEVVFTTTEEEI